jgi:Beta-lactamase
VLLALSSIPANAQEGGITAERRGQIEKAVSAFMTATSVPGVSIAILQNGKPVWSAGFGMADLEDSAPATSVTHANFTTPRTAIRCSDACLKKLTGPQVRSTCFGGRKPIRKPQ